MRQSLWVQVSLGKVSLLLGYSFIGGTFAYALILCDIIVTLTVLVVLSFLS